MEGSGAIPMVPLSQAGSTTETPCPVLSLQPPELSPQTTPTGAPESPDQPQSTQPPSPTPDGSDAQVALPNPAPKQKIWQGLVKLSRVFAAIVVFAITLMVAEYNQHLQTSRLDRKERLLRTQWRKGTSQPRHPLTYPQDTK